MKKILSLFLLPVLALSALAQSGDPLPSFGGGILACGTVPVAGTNEVQTLTFGGTPTGGTFKLTFAGAKSAAITWSATNATLVANIDAALEALSTIGTGGVTTAVATMTAGIGTITVTFTGNNAKLAVGILVAASSLTGTSPTLVPTETTPGVTADGRRSIRGQLLIDKTNGHLYQNTSGTLLNPTWAKVSDQ